METEKKGQGEKKRERDQKQEKYRKTSSGTRMVLHIGDIHQSGTSKVQTDKKSATRNKKEGPAARAGQVMAVLHMMTRLR